MKFVKEGQKNRISSYSLVSQRFRSILSIHSRITCTKCLEKLDHEARLFIACNLGNNDNKSRFSTYQIQRRNNVLSPLMSEFPKTLTEVIVKSVSIVDWVETFQAKFARLSHR